VTAASGIASTIAISERRLHRLELDPVMAPGPRLRTLVGFPPWNSRGSGCC
jgi:hypothetical protein